MRCSSTRRTGAPPGWELAARPQPAGAVGSPGVRGASLDFDLTQAGGRARLAIQDGELQFPGVFEDSAIPVERLAADLQWQVRGQELALTVDNLKFANADAEGEARASWRTGDAKGGARLPGVLDLQGSLSRADGSRVWRYLPLAIPKRARDYVHEAVVSGVATGAKFRVKGDLQHFPFAGQRGGEFQVSAQVKDVNFAYVPPSLQPGPAAWPALEQLSGELLFQGSGMQVKGVRGRVHGRPGLTVRADARIPEFRQPEVAVQGRIQGPVSESLQVVNTSPAAAMTNQVLAQASGTGAADVELRLALPLHDLALSKVQGTVTLPGNDVQISPDSPPLARARGAVLFSDKGFQLAGVHARALGGEVRLEGGTRPGAAGEPAHVQLRAQGSVTAEGLRQARELGFVARLARDFSGGTGYSLALAFRRGVPEVQVTSNLQGLGVNLPAPLNKPPEAVLPLRYETALTREALKPQARLQEVLAVELGRVGSLTLVRDLDAPEPRVLRGALAVGLAPGEAAVLPAEGVSANEAARRLRRGRLARRAGAPRRQ